MKNIAKTQILSFSDAANERVTNPLKLLERIVNKFYPPETVDSEQSSRIALDEYTRESLKDLQISTLDAFSRLDLFNNDLKNPEQRAANESVMGAMETLNALIEEEIMQPNAIAQPRSESQYTRDVAPSTKSLQRLEMNIAFLRMELDQNTQYQHLVPAMSKLEKAIIALKEISQDDYSLIQIKEINDEFVSMAEQALKIQEDVSTMKAEKIKIPNDLHQLQGFLDDFCHKFSNSLPQHLKIRIMAQGTASNDANVPRNDENILSHPTRDAG